VLCCCVVWCPCALQQDLNEYPRRASLTLDVTGEQVVKKRSAEPQSSGLCVYLLSDACTGRKGGLSVIVCDEDQSSLSLAMRCVWRLFLTHSVMTGDVIGDVATAAVMAYLENNPVSLAVEADVDADTENESAFLEEVGTALGLQLLAKV
jgi:hypothetical protein